MTVKVRIAVVVDEKGKWNADGWSHYAKDSEAMTSAIEGLEEDGEGLEEGGMMQQYWITADLEIPKVREIKGEAKKA